MGRTLKEGSVRERLEKQAAELKKSERQTGRGEELFPMGVRLAQA